jgi:hypothetical protein
VSEQEWRTARCAIRVRFAGFEHVFGTFLGLPGAFGTHTGLRPSRFVARAVRSAFGASGQKRMFIEPDEGFSFAGR